MLDLQKDVSTQLQATKPKVAAEADLEALPNGARGHERDSVIHMLEPGMHDHATTSCQYCQTCNKSCAGQN